MILKEHLSNKEVDGFWLSLNARIRVGHAMLDDAIACKDVDPERYTILVEESRKNIHIISKWLEKHCENYPKNIIVPSKEEVIGWFDELNKFGNSYNVVSTRDNRIHIKLFTRLSEFGIVASWQRDVGYLGCVAQSNDGYERGNGLHDGPLTYET